MRLWDVQSRTLLEVIPKDQILIRHPEWLHALKNEMASREARNHGKTVGDFFGDSSVCSAHLRHKTISSVLAAWEADSDATVICLLADGTFVVTQDNGQVCILKLHHGQRRITLAEVEEIFFSERKTAK
jgi:CO/xanthine dehydrogenase FAD-binding subunit